MHSPIIGQIGQVLAEGEAAGVFRSGVDPVQLYVTIAGICHFYFSNIHRLSVILDEGLSGLDGRVARRQHAVDMVLGFLCPKPFA